jgi:iron complex transport system substrate-binding protein
MDQLVAVPPRHPSRTGLEGTAAGYGAGVATFVGVRIASLLSSSTEIAFALGSGDDVVGVTFECDYPADARHGRAILVHGLDTVGRGAAEIDELVRAASESQTPMYQLDEAAFAACAPTLVLTQDLCRVCALPSGDVDVALAHLGCEAHVVSLDPHRLGEVFESIRAVALAAEVPERGDALVGALEARMAAVRAAVAGCAVPRIFVLEWTDPPFLAGHWVPDLVEAAGGLAVLSRAGERSVPTTWEAIVEAAPDVVVVAPCGFDLDGASELAHSVLASLPASAVWAMDANGCIVRPGPRLVDGVEQLAAMLHGIGEVDPAIARRIR